MSYSYQAHRPVWGVHYTESVHATAEPSKKPYTDDMRAMVEDLRERGMIQRLPAIFQTPQGLIIHPVMLAKLRTRMQEKSDSILANAIYNASALTTTPPN